MTLIAASEGTIDGAFLLLVLVLLALFLLTLVAIVSISIGLVGGIVYEAGRALGALLHPVRVPPGRHHPHDSRVPLDGLFEDEPPRAEDALHRAA